MRPEPADAAAEEAGFVVAVVAVAFLIVAEVDSDVVAVVDADGVVADSGDVVVEDLVVVVGAEDVAAAVILVAVMHPEKVNQITLFPCKALLLRLISQLCVCVFVWIVRWSCG